MGGTYNFRSAITKHNNIFKYLVRGSFRKLYKYPVKPIKYWKTLYKDLLNNLSCYLSCLCASVSSNISAFGRKYVCLPGRKYFCLSGSKLVRCGRQGTFPLKCILRLTKALV